MAQSSVHPAGPSTPCHGGPSGCVASREALAHGVEPAELVVRNDIDQLNDLSAWLNDQAPPQLSVIVLCLNEAARLPLLLADLQQSQFLLEILVSDGGSDDASPQIAELAEGASSPSSPWPGTSAGDRVG